MVLRFHRGSNSCRHIFSTKFIGYWHGPSQSDGSRTAGTNANGSTGCPAPTATTAGASTIDGHSSWKPTVYATRYELGPSESIRPSAGASTGAGCASSSGAGSSGADPSRAAIPAHDKLDRSSHRAASTIGSSQAARSSASGSFDKTGIFASGSFGGADGAAVIASAKSGPRCGADATSTSYSPTAGPAEHELDAGAGCHRSEPCTRIPRRRKFKCHGTKSSSCDTSHQRCSAKKRGWTNVRKPPCGVQRQWPTGSSARKWVYCVAMWNCAGPGGSCAAGQTDGGRSVPPIGTGKNYPTVARASDPAFD